MKDKQPETLKAVLNGFTKEDLRNNVKMLHVEGYAQYKKAELIDLIVAHILDEEVMYSCFINGSREELAAFRACTKQDQMLTQDNSFLFMYFARCGYCYVRGDALITVPGEIREAFHQLDTKAFEEARRRYALLQDYIRAAINLYTMITPEELARIFNRHYPEKQTDVTELMQVYEHVCYRESGIVFYDGQFVDLYVFDEDEENEEGTIYEIIKALQTGKQFYQPDGETFLRYADDDYIEKTDTYIQLKNHLQKKYDVEEDVADDLCEEISFTISGGGEIYDLFEILELEDVRPEGKAINEMNALLTALWNDTRMPENRGFTPKEMNEMQKKRGGAGRGGKGDIEMGKVIPFPKR